MNIRETEGGILMPEYKRGSLRLNLIREFLCSQNQKLAGAEVRLNHFRIDPEMIQSAAIVVFRDEDGTEYVLKDRDGTLSRKPVYVPDPGAPAERLRLHRLWRRGVVDLDPQDWHTPKLVDESIDAVLAAIQQAADRLRELEADLADKAGAKALVEDELDAIIVKLAAVIQAGNRLRGIVESPSPIMREIASLAVSAWDDAAGEIPMSFAHRLQAKSMGEHVDEVLAKAGAGVDVAAQASERNEVFRLLGLPAGDFGALENYAAERAALLEDKAIVDWIATHWNSQHTGQQYLLRGRALDNPTGSFRAAVNAARQEGSK